MKLLVDTQIILWQFADDPRLNGKMREQLIDEANEIVVSDVSLWEVVIKRQTGKLTVDLDNVEREIERHDYDRLPIRREHIRELQHIAFIHRDPFDRLLIAQAISENLPLLTADAKFRDYPVTLALDM